MGPNLQRDVEERSKKILKLELAGSRAKIVTHRDKPTPIETPKIEMTSLVTNKPSHSSSSSTSSRGSSTSSSSSTTNLDLIVMYQKRNEQLDHDLRRLQQELDRAKEILSEVDKQWHTGQISVSCVSIFYSFKSLGSSCRSSTFL